MKSKNQNYRIRILMVLLLVIGMIPIYSIQVIAPGGDDPAGDLASLRPRTESESYTPQPPARRGAAGGGGAETPTGPATQAELERQADNDGRSGSSDPDSSGSSGRVERDSGDNDEEGRRAQYDDVQRELEELRNSKSGDDSSSSDAGDSGSDESTREGSPDSGDSDDGDSGDSEEDERSTKERRDEYNKQFEDMSTTEFRTRQAAAAGGWVSWGLEGSYGFQNQFTSLGRAFGEESWFSDETIALVESALSVEGWADKICHDNLLRNQNGAQTKGFITSPSGETYAHAEAVRTDLNACFGEFEDRDDCTPFYGYRLSGEISAGQVPIYFSLYLEDKSGNQYCDIYSVNEDEFNCPATGDPESTELTVIELDKGLRVSLSGVSMVYWELAEKYTHICIDFHNPEQIRPVVGVDMFDPEEDDPLCVPISKDNELDYQQYEDEDAAATYSTIPSVPTTYGSSQYQPDDMVAQQTELASAGN